MHEHTTHTTHMIAIMKAVIKRKLLSCSNVAINMSMPTCTSPLLLCFLVFSLLPSKDAVVSSYSTTSTSTTTTILFTSFRPVARTTKTTQLHHSIYQGGGGRGGSGKSKTSSDVHKNSFNSIYRRGDEILSELSVMPNDNQFYDGYEEFIRNLQQDLDNDSFDIYDHDDDGGGGDVVDVVDVVDGDVAINLENNHIQDGGGGDEANLDSVAGPNEEFKPQSRIDKRKTMQRQKRSHTNNYNKRKIPRYKRDMNDDFSKTVDEATVATLIVERSKAQRDRDYVKADAILHELNNTHGVYVWDKDRLWSASPIAPSRRFRSKREDFDKNSGGRYDSIGSSNNRFGRYGHDYVQIGNEIDLEICKLELHDIHSLLAKRLEFKLIRQYNEADKIQSELYDNGVRVHDKLKQWRADGGIFADVEAMLSNKQYTINKHSDPTEDASIIEKVEERIEAWTSSRQRGDYKKADRIRQELWEEFRVAVDDKTRTYSIGGDFGPDGTFYWTDQGPINPRREQNMAKKDWRKAGMYSKSKRSEPLNHQDDEEEVWNLIHDRLEAKRVNDFDVADLIRDHLYKEYRISVDDQLRQWSVGGEFEHEATNAVQGSSPTTLDGKLDSAFVRIYHQRGGQGHLSEKEIALVKAMVKRRTEEMARYNQKAVESIRIGLKQKFYVIIDDVNGEWHVRGNAFVKSPKLEVIPGIVKRSMIEIETLIRERSQAKGEGDFGRADEIRNDLLETYGITLDDRLKEWTVIGDPAKEEISTTGDETINLLSSLTVKTLREKLRSAGLPVSGKKAELIDRLVNHI